MLLHKVGGGQCFPYFVVFSECFSIRPSKRAQREAKHVNMGSKAKQSMRRAGFSVYSPCHFLFQINNKLSAHSNGMRKQACQNPFSAVATMFITEGVYGRRRQGLDHKQPKHLQDVLHNQFETTTETFILQLLRVEGGSISQLSPFLPVCPQFPGLRLQVLREGGSISQLSPFFPVCPEFPGLLWWVTMREV